MRFSRLSAKLSDNEMSKHLRCNLPSWRHRRLLAAKSLYCCYHGWEPSALCYWPTTCKRLVNVCQCRAHVY